MGQKEYNLAIHWGQQEPSPERDLEAELSDVELICPTSAREEIAEIYWVVYQLQRAPGELPCNEETEELLCQEILDSIQECLWHKQVPTLLGEGSSWHPTRTLRCDPQADYSAQNCATYNQCKDMMWGSCEEALAVARDTHWQASAAMALREEKIERLSCSLSCGHWCSGSCRHLGSLWQRSQTASHQTKVPQAESHQGEPTRW